MIIYILFLNSNSTKESFGRAVNACAVSPPATVRISLDTNFLEQLWTVFHCSLLFMGVLFLTQLRFFFFNLCPSHLIYIHFFLHFFFFFNSYIFKKKTGVFRSVYMHHYFFPAYTFYFLNTHFSFTFFSFFSPPINFFGFFFIIDMFGSTYTHHDFFSSRIYFFVFYNRAVQDTLRMPRIIPGPTIF